MDVDKGHLISMQIDVDAAHVQGVCMISIYFTCIILTNFRIEVD